MNILKTIIVLLFIFLFSNSFCQGVYFNNLTLREAISVSKESKKPLFVLVGATKGEHATFKYYQMLKNNYLGDIINSNFIAVSYADSAIIYDTFSLKCKKNLFPELQRREFEWMEVFGIYNTPSILIISPAMEILALSSGEFTNDEIHEICNKVLKGKTIKPDLSADSHKMYPKSAKTLDLLSQTLQLYLLFNTSDSICLSRKVTETNFINMPAENLLKAKNKVMAYQEFDDFYFSCFLKSIILYDAKLLPLAKLTAEKAMNNFSEHQRITRTLSDSKMKVILKADFKK